MSKVAVGNRQLGLEDVLTVALGATVVLDEAALVEPPASASTTLAAVPEPAPTAGAVLSQVQSRAVVLSALTVLLAAGSAARPAVVKRLAAILNSNAPLALDAQQPLAQQVAALLRGDGGPGVTARELLLLTAAAGAGPAFLAGLAIYGAHAALVTADAVAAYTAEALQGSVDGLGGSGGGSGSGGEASEAPAAHAGVAACAANLRALLESSTEIGKAAAAKKAAATAAAAAAPSPVVEALAAAACAPGVANVQFVHGAAYPPIGAAVRTLASEVAAAAAATAVAAAAAPAAGAAAGGKKGKEGDGEGAGAGGGAGGGSRVVNAQPLVAAVNAAAAAVHTLAAASAARYTALSQAAAALELSLPAPLSVSAAAASPAVPVSGAQSVEAAAAAAVVLQQAVDGLVLALGSEAAAADVLISKRESAAREAAAAKEKAKAAAAAAREASEAARVAAMSPEQRAEYDAEQAKKKEKAAKRAEKEKAPGAAAAPAAAAAAAAPAASAVSNVLGLGQGTFELRCHLASATSGATGSAAAAAQHTAALSPYFPGAAVVGAAASAVVGAGAAAVAGVTVEREDGTAVPRVDTLLRRAIDRIGAGGSKRKPKIPKGARDFMPEQMEVRERCFGIIRSVFKRHGAVEIDTPVFELRDTLLGKYGEEGGKLIYDLADQGGELLSLRYDLTVPFARFLALHGVENIKRFHIARVYRRDNPAMNKGRFREFYQCDYDVAGVYAPMMPDAEVLKVAVDILSSLPIGDFSIKLNHRGLLDAVLDICGVPAAKFRPICSAIDKLDKEPWAAVREEMVAEKGLPPAVADRIGTFVQLRGEPMTLHAKLLAEGLFAGHAVANAALADLKLLFGYLEAYGALHRISFDLSLARGLDYYTGVIYEAVLTDPTIGVGSIAAGGRYDNLVGMFANPGTVVPCVGVSIGVERVFAIMEARAAAEAGGLKRTPVTVMVASIPSARYDMNRERMRVLSALWEAGLTAEMVYAADPKLQKQMTAALENGTPYLVVLGEDEMDKGEVQLKDLLGRTAANVKLAALPATIVAMVRGDPSAASATTAASAASPATVSSSSGGASGGAGAAATTTATGTTTGTTRAAAPTAVNTAQAGAGSVGVVLEGASRPIGRFARPAAPIAL